MRRWSWIAVVLLTIQGMGLANSTQNAQRALEGIATAISAELESHGERVLGKDMYHWSTRLDKIEGCRAQFSVRLANNFENSTVQVESVSFLLGSLDPYGIEMRQNHWLQVPCLERQSCVFSTSTCTRKAKDGTVIDCSTPNQKQAEVFSLQFDGDPGSAQRLQQELRQAVDACRQPDPVLF